MDELGYDQKSKSAIEKLVLGIITWYLFGMMSASATLGYSTGFAIFFAFCIILVWAAYIGKYRDYTFRALLDTVISLSACLVHLLRQEDPAASITTYMTIVVMLGMFGIPTLVKLSYLSTTIIVLFFLFRTDFMKSGYGSSSLLKLVVMSITCYIVSYVVHYIVKKQIDAKDVLLANFDELSELEKSKDDFLVNVSHELRTPVNVINGMAELLKDEEGLSEAAREKLNSIIVASRGLNASLSDILDFTELSSGNIKIEEDTYSIIDVVEEVSRFSVDRIREKKLEFIIDLEPDIPTRLVGDRGKITRVIMNIIGNAIKFTADGCVRMSIDTRKTDYGVNLNVTIRDTGKGMKKEAMEKIFTSFSQVDTKRNRAEGGVGLGLAICKELVDRMGGNIMVDSVYGSGTKVWFSIPQKIEDNASLVFVRNARSKKVAFCVDLEFFSSAQVRDAYHDSVTRMLDSMELDYRYFRNVGELKRVLSRADFTYIFVSYADYLKDTDFFNALSKRDKSRIIIIMDDGQEAGSLEEQYGIVNTPLYTVKIADVVNSEDFRENITVRKDKPFIAPDAEILVVDDNRMNIAVMTGLLRRYNIKVTGAMSGYEALEKISNTVFDLIFMDHMMPEMDGVETFEAIRLKPGSYYHDVPIIALTANVVAGTKEFFLEKGFNEYIPKPVDPEELDRTLRNYIVKSKQITLDEAAAFINEPCVTVKEPVKDKPEKTESVTSKESFYDEAAALKYCGSREGVTEMMKINYEDGPKTYHKLTDTFSRRDWQNYTIFIHALKSSMRTIGILGLSEKAAALEAAGKEGREDFILENHEEAMMDFRKALKDIGESGLFEAEPYELEAADEAASILPAEEAIDALPGISGEEFFKIASEFEEAAFEMDEGKLNALLDRMDGHVYNGRNLSKETEKLRHKVGMGDYISAFDSLQELNN